MKSKNSLFLILLILITNACMELHANDWQNIQVIAKIKAGRDKMEVSSKGKLLAYPMKLQDKALEKVIQNLKPDDEVILEGHITYEEQAKGETTIQMNPTLVIERIRPVSLSRLGRMDDFAWEAKPLTFKLDRPYSAKGMTVSQGVVASITITASVLLLKSLAGSPNDPSLGNNLNSGLIFSAGALATGFQVAEDIKKGPK